MRKLRGLAAAAIAAACFTVVAAPASADDGQNQITCAKTGALSFSCNVDGVQYDCQVQLVPFALTCRNAVSGDWYDLKQNKKL